MLRRYRFELILILLIICALVATRFFSTNAEPLNHPLRSDNPPDVSHFDSR
ncbi:Uncharacterised protein [Raoultella terrigena]|uniref:Uncharacterized protein n=1 Tax=Raoultella terrigena TaxID=577 RepID=A0A485BMS6_RAOTE|nr:Uncharacterised protein [Raoultella terrigena]